MVGEKTKSYRIKRWRASLETDLMEFCHKEGILSSEKSKRVLDDIGAILEELYETGKAKTIKDLMSIPKHQFLEYGEELFYGQRKRREECWQMMNKILRRHGFRMYIRPMVVYSND